MLQVLGSLAGCGHLTAMFPGEVPAVAVAGGITRSNVRIIASIFIDNGTIVVGSQQVAPIGVTVGVGIRCAAPVL